VAYAAEQQNRQQSDEGAKDVAYWVERLGGQITPISLPTDRPHTLDRSYASERLDIPLDPELLAQLRQAGAKAGCTFLMTFIGVVHAWLARRTGQDDVILGVPAAGQSAAEQESLVGHCVHLLPVRMKVDLTRRFVDHLRAFKPVMLDAFDHQQVTFSSVLPQIDVPYVQGRLPLVPVCVNIDAGLGKLEFGSLHAEYETIPRAFESFELFMNAVDHRDRLIIECSYNTALFDAETIRRWMRELASLAKTVVSNPELALGKISLLSEQDQAAYLELNASFVEMPGLAVHQLVERQAAERPDAVALRFGALQLSYAELNTQANRIARVLQQKSVKPGDAVGVCMTRSIALVPTLLAILKAGAAYVPLDPTFPASRLQAMVDDAEVAVVLTDAAASAFAPRTRTLLLLEELSYELAQVSGDNLSLHVDPESRAYILFTSGSTGRPKGVEIPHRAFENILLSMQQDPGFGPSDQLLAITTISFDIAGVELFLPLSVGGCVVLCSTEEASDPSALSALLENPAITFMQATPATWLMLVELGWKGRKGLRVVCTGEAFPEVLRDPLLSRVSAVWNMYGPTETCIYSSIKRVSAGEQITIGKPVANTALYILDAHSQLAPVGDVGEIFIAGRGVALGYRGRPDLTQDRFLDDPFVPGQSMYKTGDLGRLLPNGDVLCLGRSDSQVKIRGFRIELGEIETLISRTAGVGRCAVVAKQFGDDDVRLVAYAAPEPGARLDEAQILESLRANLPPYMVPHHVVLLEKLPLSTSGKVNRGALPDPVARSVAPKSVAPGLDNQAGVPQIEASLAEIWQALLKVPKVEANASFFDLGGHSVLAIKAIARVREQLGVELSLRTLFQLPTISALAQHVAQLPAVQAKPSAMQQGSKAAPAQVADLGHAPLHPASTSTGATSADVLVGLREIWTGLLRVNSVDDDQNFFELGGHSVLAVRMVGRVRDQFGVELPMRAIFDAPTLIAVAQQIVVKLQSTRSRETSNVAHEEIEL
jgi:amino acid adenylation domain-containing protein